MGNSVYSKPIFFAVLSAVVILIGTVITTFYPMVMPSTQPKSGYVKPYAALEIEGRDIYIREGCNNCHTQTIRPLRTEVLRYGDYSKPEEFAYDSPHLWGSRRVGPDLARIGGKYADSWQYVHTVSPQKMFAASNMPRYTWLAEAKLDTSYTFKKSSVLGFGYSEAEVQKQLDDERTRLTSASYRYKVQRDEAIPAGYRADLTELDALVAYLQRLGRDYKDSQKTAVASAATGGN